MNSQTNKAVLMDQLEHYGYELMRPATTASPEEVLRNLLNQDEVRLLEGFPVVLANALRQKEKLAWENPKWQPAQDFSKQAKHRFAVLLAMTHLLLKLYGLEEESSARVLKVFSKCKEKELLSQLKDAFLKSEPVRLDHLTLSTERLKNNFRTYAVQPAGGEEVRKKQQALEQELLLSQLLAPRQKELLRKKLEGKAFTKTEREYFYRVVKKKLRALANEDLHRLARQALEL